MKAVILAAGVGSRLHPLTADRPKALVDVAGKPFLFRTLERLAAVGIRGADVIVVGGYCLDVLRARLAEAGWGDCTIVFNDKYEAWNNFWSLYVARDAVGGAPFLQLDGDVLFDEKLLPRVLAAKGAALLAVDVRQNLDAEAMKVQLDGAEVRKLSKQLEPRACQGEAIGIARLGPGAAAEVFEHLLAMSREGKTNEYYEAAYQRAMDGGRHPFGIVDVHDCGVTEIDDVNDLRRAEAMLAGR
jgi:choline kinase